VRANSSKRLRHAKALTLAVVLGFALAGCGRKGQLEPPVGANLPKTQGAQQKPDPTARLEGAARVPGGAIVPPKASFPLDPIL